MMKKILFAGLVAFSLTSFGHAEDLKPILQPKVFTGPSGEKMTMVFVEPADKHRVLIRFENFADSVWNDKVIMHVKKGDSDKTIYQSTEMQRPTVEVRPDNGVEVRPRGAKADVQMGEWSGNIEDIHPYELINAYAAQLKK